MLSRHTHWPNTWASAQTGVSVVLHRLICNSLVLSKSASRCNHCSTLLRNKTFTMTLIRSFPNNRCIHVIQGFTNYSAWADHFISAAIVRIILNITDRKAPLSPNLLAPLNWCLMMFYHTLGNMSPFICVFKKTCLTVEYWCQLKGDWYAPSPTIFPASLSFFSSSLLLFRILHFH